MIRLSPRGRGHRGGGGGGGGRREFFRHRCNALRHVPVKRERQSGAICIVEQVESRDGFPMRMYIARARAGIL